MICSSLSPTCAGTSPLLQKVFILLLPLSVCSHSSIFFVYADDKFWKKLYVLHFQVVLFSHRDDVCFYSSWRQRYVERKSMVAAKGIYLNSLFNTLYLYIFFLYFIFATSTPSLVIMLCVHPPLMFIIFIVIFISTFRFIFGC